MADSMINNNDNTGIMDSWEDRDDVPMRKETDLEYDEASSSSSEEEEKEENIPLWVALHWVRGEVVDRRKLSYNEEKDRYEYVIDMRLLRRGQYVSDDDEEYWKWEGKGEPKWVALKWSGENIVEKKSTLTYNTMQGKYEYPSSVSILRKGAFVAFEDTDNCNEYVRWGTEEEKDEEYPEVGSAKKEPKKVGIGKMEFTKNSQKYRMGASTTMGSAPVGLGSAPVGLDVPSGDEEDSVNQRRTEAFNNLATQDRANVSFTRLCNSLQNGVPCPHGNNCQFAHSQEQLRITDCVFGADCRFVTRREGTNLYFNNKPRPGTVQKICHHLHPGETRETYMKRTGIDRIAPRVAREERRAAVFSPNRKISVPQMRQPTPEEIQNMQALRIAQLEAELDKKWNVREKEEDELKAKKENDDLLKEVMSSAPLGLDRKPERVKPIENKPIEIKPIENKATEIKPADNNTLVIRVPQEQYMAALEMAMRSGRGSVQVEIM